MLENIKIVALVSGGIDSLVTEYNLLKSNYEIYPFFVHYKQKSVQKEKQSIMEFNNFLRKEFPGKINKTKSFRFVHNFFKNGNLITSSTPIPEDNKKSDFFVPMRNLLFISLASVYASRNNISNIAIGSHIEIPTAFPDSSPEFIASMQESLSRASYTEWKIITPFLNSFKSDIVKYGIDNNLPLELTWSCYNNSEHHCGFCKACKDRKKAFEKLGVNDPTDYEKYW